MLVLFAYSFNASCADVNKHVYILTSTNSKHQAAIARSIEKGLQDTAYKPEILSHNDVGKLNPARADFIVNINAETLINPVDSTDTIPLLHVSSKVNLNNAYKDKRINLATIYIPQPYCRQIQFISLVNSKWKTIGVLTSKIDSIDRLTLMGCAKKHGLKINFSQVDDENNLTKELKKTLRNSDVILALPDIHIYNSRTVKNVLLTAYRHRKPIIGFSDNFVQAGALTAIFTSPEQLGDQIAELIKDFFSNNEKFSDVIFYPKYCTIKTNNQVFRALGLDIPDLKYIEKTLKKACEPQ